MRRRNLIQGLIMGLIFYGAIAGLCMPERDRVIFEGLSVKFILTVAGATAALWHAVVIFIDILKSAGRVSAEELYEKGRLAYLKGNADLALFYFKKLNLGYPLDEDGWYQHGKILMELNRTEEARKIWNVYLSKPFQKWRDEILLQLDGGL